LRVESDVIQQFLTGKVKIFRLAAKPRQEPLRTHLCLGLGVVAGEQVHLEREPVGSGQ